MKQHAKLENHRRNDMGTMINKLKENALNNQLGALNPPAPVPPAQPQQPQMALPAGNPHLQAIEGMQRRKGELERQYNNMDHTGSMLNSAAQAVMNSAPGESPLGVIARGLMGATQGLQKHGMERNENLRQQAEIDQTISNTYQFVQDYEYNKALKREEMGMKHRELDLKEMDILAKQDKYGREDAKMQLKQEKLMHEQEKFKHETSKGVLEDYETNKKIFNKLKQLKEKTDTLDHWDAYTGKLLGGDPLKIAMVGKNKVKDLQEVDKLTNELVVLVSESGHGRGSDQLRKLVKDGKVHLGMGLPSMKTILNNSLNEYSNYMKRDSFALDTINKGVPINVGLRAYDAHLGNPKVYSNPNEVVEFYKEFGEMPTPEAMVMYRQEKKKRQGGERAQHRDMPEQTMQQQALDETLDVSPTSLNEDVDKLTRNILGM